MGYNLGLEIGNNGRSEAKETMVSEIISHIHNNWKTYEKEEEDILKTKFGKIAEILKQDGYISSRNDLSRKMSDLKDEGYSLDQISKAISKIASEKIIGETISIHKQSVARVIEVEKVKMTNKIH